MTVQELIDELQKIEDKTKEVFASDSEFGNGPITSVIDYDDMGIKLGF